MVVWLKVLVMLGSPSSERTSAMLIPGFTMACASETEFMLPILLSLWMLENVQPVRNIAVKKAKKINGCVRRKDFFM